MISDQTPWRGLEEKGVGWDLPLDRPELFQQVLQMCVDMNNDEYMKWSEKALGYGLGGTRDDGVVEQNRRLFMNHRVGESKSQRVVNLRVVGGRGNENLM